jgi:hypothetical protein
MRANKRFKRHWIYRFRGILPLVVGVVVLVFGTGSFNPSNFTAQFANAKYSGSTQKGPCNIKGNVSYNKDRKIYHVPGQKDYINTVISSQRGERWFCSEADARANGWKKAGR